MKLGKRLFMAAAGGIAMVATLLAGCGGSGAISQILSGGAAIGQPIASGNVNITCAGGSALNTRTGGNGAWSVTLSGQTLPCVVQVSGGTVNGVANTVSYHSLAMSMGTVNITPLTDLLVANLAGQNPGAWFGALNAAGFNQLNQAAVDAALANLRAALAGVNGLNGLAGINPLTTPFNAVTGDPLDALLEALQLALNGAGSNYGALLALAQVGGGFNAGLPTGGTGGGTTGGGTTLPAGWPDRS